MKQISQEQFDEQLRLLLSEMTADKLLHLPGIYEIVSEEYNNEVIDKWEASL